jgi:uncharacterized protein (DUF2252 family)
MSTAATSHHVSRSVRRAQGKAKRDTVPRTAHAVWSPSPGRPDPVSLLERSNATRVPELVPVRYARMLASPFTYLRGSPVVMADDLARTPVTGFGVQACGDAHLLNFGVFATPERHLVFDLNDFDETLPGPWEWDLKRLAVSLVTAARERSESADVAADVCRAGGARYQAAMRHFAGLGNLDVWYSRIDVEDLEAMVDETRRASFDRGVDRARHHTSLAALPKLTEVVDGRRRIIDDPPLVEHLPDTAGVDQPALIDHLLRDYRHSLPEERRALLDRYEFVDVARKVVGVGSVGTRCWVMLLVGADGHDPLFLQLKQAQSSVLEPHCAPCRHRHQGQRVVVGQHLMQAASDIFLGWTTGPGGDQFYVRQLRDMKGSVNLATLGGAQLRSYAELCGAALARAHARTGDAARISGYLGTGGAFVEAVTAFATAYADQNERDYEALRTAASTGRIEVAEGV